MTGLERLASDRHSGLFVRKIIDEDLLILTPGEASEA